MFRQPKNNKLQELSAKHLKGLTTQEIIRNAGGWNEGHFVFRTGEHGDGYINKMGFLRYPTVMKEIGNRLGDNYKDLAKKIDVVVGPSIIGAVISCAVAERLEVPFTLTYRKTIDNSIAFHKGFMPEQNARCLFVDDFVFSGKDLKDNINFMINAGMIVVGASVIGVRNKIELPVPLRHLIQIDFVKTSPESCRCCLQGIPVTASNIRE